MLINVHVKYKRYVPITIFIEVCASKSELRDRCERADLFGLLLHVTGIRVTSLLHHYSNTFFYVQYLDTFMCFHFVPCVLLSFVHSAVSTVFCVFCCVSVHHVFRCASSVSLRYM